TLVHRTAGTVTSRPEALPMESPSMRSPTLDLQAVAREELEETPQLKDTISELRELINAESDLKCPSDEPFLVKFLRARKYRVEEAFSTIRKYFRIRQVHQDIFRDLLPSRIMFNEVFHRNKLVTILEQRDHLGRLVAILRLGAWRPDMCPLNELFRAGVLVGEHFLLDETTQIAGVVAVVDLEGLSFEHFRHYTPSVIKKLIQLAQECYPIRIKGIYITNNPPIFELIYSAAKLFLKPKLVDRTHFVGRDYKKLHALIPRERLPEEYDGTGAQQNYDGFEKSLRNIEHFYQQLASYVLNTEIAPFDLQAVAYEELGETPELKRDTISELRKLINAEPDFSCPSDEPFLIKFLRPRKYRVEEAFTTIRKWLRARQVHQDLYLDLLPSRIMFNAVFHENKLMTILEERDQLGRLAVVFKFGAWSPDICTLHEFFRACIVAFEYCLLDEATQVAGVVVVVDLEGLGFGHFRHYTPFEIKMFIELSQDSPGTITACNISQITMNLLQPHRLRLRRMLAPRIHFVGRDYKKLHALIPRGRLPEEYGGTQSQRSYDSLEKSLRNVEDLYVQIGRCGYRTT
ncbi:unnamed protein product, partial [Ixodes hexagonus]